MTRELSKHGLVFFSYEGVLLPVRHFSRTENLELFATLQELSSSYTLIAISALSLKFAKENLRIRRLLPIFSDVLCDPSDDRSETIGLCLADSDCHSHEALFVADTVRDVKAALSVNVHSIGVAWGRKKPAELGLPPDAHEIRRPSELSVAIHGLLSFRPVRRHDLKRHEVCEL